MKSTIASTETAPNPLDSVEEVLTQNNWAFNRMTDNELIVEVSGKSCDYKLFFIWQRDMSTLQFCCQYDLTIKHPNLGQAAKILMSLNEALWMGHFDIPRETGTPSFRHTCLLRGVTGVTNAEIIEDLVEISLSQCERYFPTFYLLAQGKTADDSSLTLALMETSGEA